MACDNLINSNADSEMEEGEIIDELDELSDISSEEEFLLRQRLQVLENYNNVLERKEAKRTSIGPGKSHRRVEATYDQYEISGTDADDGFPNLKYRNTKEHKQTRLYKQKKIKQTINVRYRESKKKGQRKKKVEVKSNSDTSDISDDEYKNKRRKLADAVTLNKAKNDTTTLKDRINRMLCVSRTENHIININNNTVEGMRLENKKDKLEVCKRQQENIKATDDPPSNTKSCELIDLCTDDSSLVSLSGVDTVDSVPTEKSIEGNSDEDLEVLRQHALKTKSKTTEKTNINKEITENKQNLSEEEDSDTAELRLICLKSALLKKAIEMKRKQKLQKRLSQSVSDSFDVKCDNEINIDNNTDVESVDMDIGSDAEDKGKITDCNHENGNQNILEDNSCKKKPHKDDELEEDEDLLRAKLLTSLSKNLPNLLNINVLKSALDGSETKKESVKEIKSDKIKDVPSAAVPEEKKFVIQLGDSDSEGEHEATKNLTKMHLKLSEQAEFQMKLDNLLKSVRNKTEETSLPDVVQQPVRPAHKFVAKAMNHLPKSEQIEYRNLVKRMAELEKIKQARQITNNQMTKDTLKPRNVSIDPRKTFPSKNIEDKIALSRKKIAEESSKIFKLKEEAKKLSQRYKIVSTELRNITTAITINKKHQRTVQDSLTSIRLQHQVLLQQGIERHSNRIPPRANIKITTKLQKENDPSKEDYKVENNLKALKVSVVNDLNEVALPTLSVHLDVHTNKKNVKIPSTPTADRVGGCNGDDVTPEDRESETDTHPRLKCEATESPKEIAGASDYVSPLNSLECKNWKDPNGVFCRFEVGGTCRDPDCKYYHPDTPSQK
ncbi:putative intracellular protein transport protein USO1 [Danaus plexippus plexippus]|uniref:Intracellular protein transport protein USO1 n=1 Tax=Danaus plexippus plexippus TaxID=278856 RepID=A0A212EZE0_DANPL|nr:putative intracellular protein transport protein USO1 [Danaus plexippus plexippus]